MDWAGILIGSAIGLAGSLLVSWTFYVRAGSDLKREASDLKRKAEELGQLISLILRGMHNSELVEIIWNEQGKPIGMVVKGSGTISGEGSLSADPTDRHDEEPH